MEEDNTKQEHKRLAGVVKGVHANLRKKLRSNDGDFHEVWENHCQNKELLAEYAEAMHHLATDHWNLKTETRIDWCYETVMEYFHQDGLQKLLNKEAKRLLKNASDEMYSLSTPSVELDAPETFSQPYSSTSTNCDAVTSSSVVFNSVEFQDSSWEEISIIPCYRSSNHGNRESNGITTETMEDSAVIMTIGSDIGATSSQIQPISILSDCTISSINSESVNDVLEESAAIVSSDTENVSEASGSSSNISVKIPQHSNRLYNQITLPFKGKIRLLDVGSCYNPFLQFEEIQAIGIDISPAKPSVYHCDFLNLETTEPLQLAADTLDTYISSLKDPIEKLPKDIFHVCVFSLLLEYFPSPYQRWMCCQKAHELLVLNGLLIIITPDSHGQHRNTPMMKSWKLAIESMGFKRWRYVKKEHIHCLAFRKIKNPVKEDCLMTDITPDLMYIPQDNNTEYNEPLRSYIPFSIEDEEFFRATMQELPICPSDDESTATSEEFIS